MEPTTITQAGAFEVRIFDTKLCRCCVEWIATEDGGCFPIVSTVDLGLKQIRIGTMTIVNDQADCVNDH